METKLEVRYEGKPYAELDEALRGTLTLFGYEQKEQRWDIKKEVTSSLFQKEVEG